MLHDDYSTLNVTNCVIDNNNNVPHAENECAWNMHHTPSTGTTVIRCSTLFRVSMEKETKELPYTMVFHQPSL